MSTVYVNMSSQNVQSHSTNVFDECQSPSIGIFDISGVFIAYLSCQCGQPECSVTISNAMSPSNNHSNGINFKISSSAISNISNIKSIKLSQNGDTLIVLARDQDNVSLQVFKLCNYSSRLCPYTQSATLLIQRQMTYQ